MAKKKNKMSTADAVKVLANEMKVVKENQQMMLSSQKKAIISRQFHQMLLLVQAA